MPPSAHPALVRVPLAWCLKPRGLGGSAENRTKQNPLGLFRPPGLAHTGVCWTASVCLNSLAALRASGRQGPGHQDCPLGGNESSRPGATLLPAGPSPGGSWPQTPPGPAVTVQASPAVTVQASPAVTFQVSAVYPHRWTLPHPKPRSSSSQRRRRPCSQCLTWDLAPGWGPHWTNPRSPPWPAGKVVLSHSTFRECPPHA